MTLGTLYLGNYGTIGHLGYAGFLVSTVGTSVSKNQGYLFGGPHKEAESILGSILGPT